MGFRAAAAIMPRTGAAGDHGAAGAVLLLSVSARKQ
jgi:hypothetical protein